ncbi:pyrroline-5-carboxylate reductase [Methylosinus sporium]|uniref:Pyrroline-5-carboxylate reductase n=1 Tax=Methylosinus sporium TaxID=428 RepID=A0A549T8Z0_METSR|nr:MULTISPECIES: pyrroline-5-carboxylate reductase [Methylosinus]MBU3887707.1 pyrroline-5-carboxylate reductase [Methylosinus sp. KRF6]TRL38334.1 pyrroline-5-carboxylate reductase [Methylosinus sporium]
MADAAELPRSITLVGAGKMGFALLQGWAARGLSGAGVTIVEPQPSPALVSLAQERGFRLNPENREAPRALLLAVKPQALDQVAPTIAGEAGSDTLIVSILAGKRVADLSARLPQARLFVRAMPNTPAAIGRGITGAFAAPAVDTENRALAETLLAAVGEVVWVEAEPLVDAVTSVSGSGPAYVFYFVECLTRAGVEAGLPEETAAQLARATVSGAGELLRQSAGTTPASLRQNVTSPGGTTAAALEVLMASDGLAPLLERAVAAAKRRAGELSG